ncbi:MAG: universal stress protein, partial [Actinomycetia bacterium]|nr:universal stress protein [Actinomycetes bacterium]
ICKAGDPLREILLAAEENDASLILMGSHGKSVIREWLTGSVSLNVIRTANRPALVIHETA